MQAPWNKWRNVLISKAKRVFCFKCYLLRKNIQRVRERERERLHFHLNDTFGMFFTRSVWDWFWATKTRWNSITFLIETILFYLKPKLKTLSVWEGEWERKLWLEQHGIVKQCYQHANTPTCYCITASGIVQWTRNITRRKEKKCTV